MAIIVLAPIIVCIAGLLLYAADTLPKTQAIGLHMFWVGLFVTLLQLPAIIAHR